jgi:clan AA aspartic protease (TIGR02281 family)
MTAATGVRSRVLAAVLVGAMGLFGCSPTGGNVADSGQSSAAPSAAVASASPAAAVVNPAAQNVALEDDGGTYRIPVLINGAMDVKFTIDSGASDVSIPADVVAKLVQSGTVTRADFIGRQTFELADGSTVPSAVFRIRSLKVGTLELQNVTASMSNANSEPLLGQSFLSRLSSWSIDNQHHALVLNAAATDSSGLPAAEPGFVMSGPHGGDVQTDTGPAASDDDGYASGGVSSAAPSDAAQSDAN